MTFIGLVSIVETVVYAADLIGTRNNTKLMINQLLDTVEYTLAIAAYTNNEQIAKEVSDGLLRHDFIMKVKIQGDQGLLIDKAINRDGKEGSEIKRTLISPFDHQQIIGSVSVSPNENYKMGGATPNPALYVINVIILISLSCTIFLWVFRRSVLQDLTLISNILQINNYGDHKVPLPLENLSSSELYPLVYHIKMILEKLDAKSNLEHTSCENTEILKNNGLAPTGHSNDLIQDNNLSENIQK